MAAGSRRIVPEGMPQDARRALPSVGAKLSRRATFSMLSASLAASAGRAVADPPPLVVAVFGDSQGEGVAMGLRRVTRRHPQLKVQNRTRAGSAISQPADYDWQAAIKAYVASEQAYSAVMFFGGNDRLPIRLDKQRAIPFRSDAWREVYAARVADMLATLRQANIRVVWLGQPVVRDAGYGSDMEYLTGIYQEAVAAVDGTFVELRSVVADPAGNYASHGRSLDGRTERMRLDDGIHFTPSGYDLIAERVVQAIGTPAEAAS